MSIITIVGAGQMGSAMSVPARTNGHEVRIVGTPLDRAVIDRTREDRWHINLKRTLPEGCKFYQFEEMGAALFLCRFIVKKLSPGGCKPFAKRA